MSSRAMRAALFAGVLLMMIGALPRSSRAEAPNRRVAVIASLVPKSGTEPELTSIAVFEEAARVLSFYARVELVPRVEMLKPALDDALRECGSDVGCTAALLEREVGADYAIAIVVNLDAPTPLSSARLIDCHARRNAAQELADITPDRVRIVRALEDQIAALFAAIGEQARAMLVVDVSPLAAELELDVDSVPAGEAPHSFLLAARDRQPVRVRAKLDGYLPATAEAIVTPKTETRVALVLEPEAGLLGSPWFWAGAAAVVVAGAITAIAIVAAGPGHLCQSRDLSPCE